MASDWRYLQLKDVIDLVADNRGRNPESYSSEGIPVIDNYLIISEGYVNLNEVKRYIDESTYESFIRKHIQENDVLVTLVGNGYGQVALTPSAKCVIIQNTIGLRCNSSHDNVFLYYLLKNNRKALMNLNIGAAQPSIKVGDLTNLEFQFPPLPEQKAIAHILGSLDDKIELNRQMNQTLEAMAQALFKSWFVDFDPVINNALAAGNAIPDELLERAEQRKAIEKKDNSDIQDLFPDEFELNEEMRWIPKEWEVKNLSEITENIFSGGTPNTRKAEYWNGGLKWFSSGETRESIVIETEKNITEIGVSESSTKLARYGDVLIASAGQGHTRGQTSFCSIDTYFNQSVVCIRPQKSIHYSWLFFNLYGRYEEMRGLSDSHSIRGSLTTKLLSSMPIIKPNENILAEYENIIGTHILKIKENKLINNNIAKLRDTLLPKLMSGELRIADATALVYEVL